MKLTKDELRTLVLDLHPQISTIIEHVPGEPFKTFYRLLMVGQILGWWKDKEEDDPITKEFKSLCRCLIIEHRARYEEEAIDEFMLDEIHTAIDETLDDEVATTIENQ